MQKIPKPIRNVFIFLFIFLVVIMGISTLESKYKPKKEKKEFFTTTSNSVLFFKNVRSLFYRTEQHEPSKSFIYTVEGVFEKEPNILVPKIVQAYAIDRAFLFMDFKGGLKGLDDFILVTSDSIESKKSDSIHFNLGSILGQFQFATHINEAILKEKEIAVIDKNKYRFAIMTLPESRAKFKMIFKDFEGLVRE